MAWAQSAFRAIELPPGFELPPAELPPAELPPALAGGYFIILCASQIHVLQYNPHILPDMFLCCDTLPGGYSGAY
jgi:hypothetical protein